MSCSSSVMLSVVRLFEEFFLTNVQFEVCAQGQTIFFPPSGKHSLHFHHCDLTLRICLLCVPVCCQRRKTVAYCLAMLLF